MEIGDTAFDVADRLAIINMFGAYAYTYDENHLDDFRALFTDSPELVVQHEDRSLSQDVDTVMSFLAARKAAFQAENNQRRHALNSFWFTGQDATEARGRCYVQVFAIRDAGPPSAELTGCYEFAGPTYEAVRPLAGAAAVRGAPGGLKDLGTVREICRTSLFLRTILRLPYKCLRNPQSL
ncbi:MAG TPA: nuclear transport factor 2 family protein, partial [Mycobacterium sp.]|nr:nuclear transport factor 2 family protein [Mycobacterium sp.]